MYMESECIFCKISKNQAPALKIYEDDYILAFLDINPATYGHTLVIPKQHYKDIFDIKSEILEKIIKVVKIISERSIDRLGCTGVNIVNANGKDAQQSVFHFHIHIIPRYSNDGMDLWFHRRNSKRIIDLNEVFEKMK